MNFKNYHENPPNEPNWTLISYFLLLIVLSNVLHNLLKPLWLILCRPSPEEIPIRSEMRTLKVEQNELSIKDDFVLHSRIQRKLNKLEDQLSDIVQTRIEKNAFTKNAIQYGLQLLLGLLVFVSVIYFRRQPLIVLKHDLFPFENLFGYPSGVPHAITPHAWVIMCKVSCSTITKAIQKFSYRKTSQTTT